MKTLFAILVMACFSGTLLVSFVSVTGCWTRSNMGGIAPMDEEFSVSVPLSSKIKQGESAAIELMLNRGASFKQDVQLEARADGIQVTPRNILARSGGSPDVQIGVSAAKDTALGEYTVSVKGIPMKGRSAATAFMVEVVP